MSEIRATTISDLAGTGPATLTKQSAAKAWVNFNGTGTIAARDSFNVSSLTDNATGDYVTSFTSSFANINYVATFGNNSGAAYILNYYNADNVFTGSLRLYSYNASAEADVNIATCDIMGDLA